MDGFAVDLDHLLDEFEQTEDTHRQVTQVGEIAQKVACDSLAGPIPTDFTTTVTTTGLAYRVPCSPDNLDLSEADFGPSPPRSHAAISQLKIEGASEVNGGYFIPESSGPAYSQHSIRSGDGQSNACTTASATCNEQMAALQIGDCTAPGEHTAQVHAVSRPELLQDTNGGITRPTEAASACGSDSKLVTVSSGWISQPDVVPMEPSAVADVSHAPCHDIPHVHTGYAGMAELSSLDTAGDVNGRVDSSVTKSVQQTVAGVAKPCEANISEVSRARPMPSAIHVQEGSHVPSVIADDKAVSQSSNALPSATQTVVEGLRPSAPTETSLPNVTPVESVDLATCGTGTVKPVGQHPNKSAMEQPTQEGTSSSNKNCCDNTNVEVCPELKELSEGNAAESQSGLASDITMQTTMTEAQSNQMETSSEMSSGNWKMMGSVEMGSATDTQPVERTDPNTSIAPSTENTALEIEGILEHILDSGPPAEQESGAVCDMQSLEERRGSEGSVERFLAPAITSPMVTTPMEDSGFSKVPGFTPDLSVMPAVTEVDEHSMSGSDISSLKSTEVPTIGRHASGSGDHPTAPGMDQPAVLPSLNSAVSGAPETQAVGIPSGRDLSPHSMGARPKELSVSPQPKKNRPNSLLGLSTPDIGSLKPQDPASVSSGFTDASGFADCAAPAGNNTSDLDLDRPVVDAGNAHDIINMQLAQKNMSPLRKKQLNLEIKQRICDSEGSGEHGVQSVPGGPGDTISVVSGDPAPGVAIPTLGSQGLTDPEPVEGLIGQQIPSPGSQPSVGGPPVATIPPSSLSLPAPASDAPPGSPSGHQMSAALMGHQQQQAKQRRPNSLNLPPRGEFQPGQSPTADEMDSVTGEYGHRITYHGSDGNHTPSGSTSSTPSQTGVPALPPNVVVIPSPVHSGPPGMQAVAPTSSNINLAITQLGKVAPEWVPDSDAATCMQCEARFTFTKRRHHCRACGKVFCSQCCNVRTKIHHMENREARVCSKCFQDLIRAQSYEKMHQPGPSPNPNNPSEYCSTLPPIQQVNLNQPPPAVMVPVGVLRKEGSQRRPESRQVMFSDGIRPGGDLTELDGSDARLPPQRTSGRRSRRVEKNADNKTSTPKARTVKTAEATKSPCLIPETGLPPVLLSTGVKGDFSVEENPEPEKVLPQIRSTEDPSPVVFAINKNLFVMVKIVNLDCCVNRVCWCFTTKGMCTVGQEELVIVLECLPDEKTIPRDIFCHFLSVYEEASKGNTVANLGHTIFAQGFLDSHDHGGFLYIRPTFQCLQKLLLPQPPYVFGILLQKWETPWAKIFPVRLMLRLGAEYRYYPCPLISVRFRKPVYAEIGHTIMNLLADFRNYQYMLPQARGVTIHMEDKKTYINFPKNRYNDVMKILDNSNDHVMAMGANFSTEADSHLVCIQNEDGNYQTQAINIQNKPRKGSATIAVTGASFVVFNGALKSSSGLRAKSSIVEDGLMVQIMPESMLALKQAIKDMQGYTVGCGSLDAEQPEEYVIAQWVEEDRNVNIGVKSPIDNMPMDGVESLHLHNTTDYIGERHILRWTEVFFIQNEDQGSSGDPVDLSRLGETLAQACCLALTGHLDHLKEAGLTKIGLRVTIDAEKVGYEVGANGEKLPDLYMNDMDNELIPIIHNAASHSQEGPVVLELILHVIE